MLAENEPSRVKIQADEPNYAQLYTSKPQLMPEVKIENIENQVKIEEDYTNMMVFYANETRVKAEELTDQQEKRKAKEKVPKTKIIKTKTIIIQKNSSSEGVTNKKKCKDKRTGKYEQSLAQRFIKRITGYHYCKNFNQFYHKQMSVFIKEKQKNQVSQSEINQNQIYCFKNNLSDSITRTDFVELTNYILLSVKAYEPYMKKYKQTMIFELFQGSDFTIFQTFFRNLFKKVYEIMIRVTYRKCLTEMLKMNLNQMQIKSLSYNGLDQVGENQIASAFDMVFRNCISEEQNKIQSRKELLRLKLQKLAEMQ